MTAAMEGMVWHQMAIVVYLGGTGIRPVGIPYQIVADPQQQLSSTASCSSTLKQESPQQKPSSPLASVQKEYRSPGFDLPEQEADAQPTEENDQLALESATEDLEAPCIGFDEEVRELNETLESLLGLTLT
jgi:hypothetical protein